jgi:predicted RNase H-like HicB family nuclease
MYRVGLSRFESSVTAIVFDLPGCASDGADAEEALRMAPIAIAERLAWERGMGRAVDLSGEIVINVSEDVVAGETGAADGEFCFEDDLRPLSDREIDDAIAVLECSRRDLLAAIGGLPARVLDWRPPLSAMARVDEWNPGVRTIREIVSEIASAEFYYRTAVRDGASPDEPAADLQDAELRRTRLLDALSALTPEERGRRFTRTLSWQTASEHWTARKVVRRVIGHERFHTAEIRQRLTWILLGTPDFRR